MKILTITIIGFFYVLQKSMYLPWDNIVPLFHGCSAVTVTPFLKTLNGQIVFDLVRVPKDVLQKFCTGEFTPPIYL